MTEQDTPAGDGVLGQSLEQAVAVVADQTGTDPTTVRQRLDSIAADGQITEASVQGALADVAKYVSTPETRLELAERALGDARESAREHDDVPTVAHRLGHHEARLSELRATLDDVRAALQDRLDDAPHPDDPLAFATAITRLKDDADALARSIDEAAENVEQFTTWLETPDHRTDELAADLDALDQALDDAAARLDTADADELRSIVLAHHVRALLLTDLRADLADLRTLDDRAGGPTSDRLDDLAAHLDDLAARHESLDTRLADRRSVLDDQARETVDQVAAALQDHSPPVEWGRVDAVLSSTRTGSD